MVLTLTKATKRHHARGCHRAICDIAQQLGKYDNPCWVQSYLATFTCCQMIHWKFCLLKCPTVTYRNFYGPHWWNHNTQQDEMVNCLCAQPPRTDCLQSNSKIRRHHLLDHGRSSQTLIKRSWKYWHVYLKTFVKTTRQGYIIKSIVLR